MTRLMIATISHQTSVRLAEVGFLLILISGIWLAAAELPQFKWRKFRSIVAGVVLAAAGIVLIIATHWGSFG